MKRSTCKFCSSVVICGNKEDIQMELDEHYLNCKKYRVLAPKTPYGV